MDQISDCNLGSFLFLGSLVVAFVLAGLYMVVQRWLTSRRA